MVAPSPQTYTPAHLAEKILTSKAALERERKQVTVLFADLKGSMELLADRDPEEARQLLDPVSERMMDAVHRYEGTVNQVMGDGIMALFGAPIAHEDHAVRACYAALAMQGAVKEYAAEVQHTRGVPIHIRVGLNAGAVVVRSIGSDLHMDYTAVGQTTHLAARMEQMAMPGSILITADVLRFAEGYVQVAAVTGFTRFVGRDAELQTLNRALQRAGAGQGQVMAVIGEPGVGKSRLFWEFIQSHRTYSWRILECRSVSYGKATAYLPVIDLLKAYCGVDTHDDTRGVREKVTGKLLTLERALERTLPAILTLLGDRLQSRRGRRSPSYRERGCIAASRTYMPPSSSTKLISSPSTSIPSSTPSLTRSPTGASCRSGGGRCTPASSRPWRRSPGSG